MKKMRRSLSSYLPDGSGGKRKQMMLAATGVVLGAIILVAIVAVALTVLSKGPGTPAATPTPEPMTTPTPVPTVTPTPSPTPKPTPMSGQAFSSDGPFVMRAYLNGNNGQCTVGLKLAPGATTVDINRTTMSIECDGKMYENVWSIRPMDWDAPPDDTVLEPDENIATILDTVKLGIPQGRPITIKFYKNGDFMQEISVAPTY